MVTDSNTIKLLLQGVWFLVNQGQFSAGLLSEDRPTFKETTILQSLTGHSHQRLPGKFRNFQLKAFKAFAQKRHSKRALNTTPGAPHQSSERGNVMTEGRRRTLAENRRTLAENRKKLRIGLGGRDTFTFFFSFK